MRIAQDFAFYVEEGRPVTAIKLLRRFIYWANQQPNVDEVLVSVTHGIGDLDRVKVLYEKLGMTHIGGVFSMPLRERISYAAA
jgi:hypothetical protein